jgi:hypothetical protein
MRCPLTHTLTLPYVMHLGLNMTVSNAATGYTTKRGDFAHPQALSSICCFTQK